MKKISLLFCALCALAMTGKAQTYIDNIAYDYYGSGSSRYAVVTNNYMTGYEGDIVIPDTIEIDGDKYPVTAIGTYAFEYAHDLTSVTLPNTIKVIYGEAFHECYKLRSINLPEGLEQIMQDAFWDCQSLTELTLPSTLKRIEAYAFEGCYSLRTINFPESLEYADGFLFQGDTLSAPVYNSKYFAHFPPNYATSYTVPDGIVTILDGAFQDAESLTSVTLPSSVKYIKNDAFNGTGLTAITLPEGVETIGSQAFLGTNIASLHLPASLTYIEPNAIPTTVTTITVDEANSEYYIANSCLVRKYNNALVYAPEGATLPDVITEIGDQAFMGRTFTSFTIPSTITRIGAEAFAYCYLLDSIIIPESVTAIAGNAFFSCYNLKKVVLPDGLKEISPYTFYECQSLAEINVPSSLESIGSGAFGYCYALKSFNLPESTTQLGTEIFAASGVEHPIYNSKYFAYMPPAYKGVYTMPDVREICPYAFYYCDSLTEVIFPETLRKIGNEAFWGCTALQRIDLPASVDTLESYAFEDCESVETLILRGAPSFYDNYVFAFYDQSKLKEVWNYAETPFAFISQGDPFYDVPNKDQIKLYVPEGSVDAYKAANYWKEFDVQPMPEIHTDIDIVDGQESKGASEHSGTSRKTLRNGQLLIERDGRVYTVDGRPVR